MSIGLTKIPVAILVCCVIGGSSRSRRDYEGVPPQIANPSAGYEFEMTMRTGTEPMEWAKILSGVSEGDPKSEYRWTGPESSFEFRLEQSGNLIFRTEYFVSDKVLAQTHPQTVILTINDVVLHRHLESAPGIKQWSVPIPADLLLKMPTTRVTLTVKPPYIETNGEQLGILLHRVGFARKESE